MTRFAQTAVPDREILLGAAQLIEDRGLARKSYSDGACYCMAGALGVAAGVSPCRGNELAVAHKLAKFIAQEVVDDEVSVFEVITGYSDAREAPEVAATLRRAADAIAPLPDPDFEDDSREAAGLFMGIL